MPPHSIYFQVLGDQGFIGLIIFVAIISLSYFKAGRIGRKNQTLEGPDWVSNLAVMIQVSVLAYALGGAALNFAYFEMVYAIYALIIILEHQFLPRERTSIAA